MTGQTQNIVAKMRAPAKSLADGYAVRLDAHLAKLADDNARREMCGRELANWTNRYEAFCLAVDGGKLALKADGPTSFDYLATMAVISERKARYTQPTLTEASKAFWESRDA